MLCTLILLSAHSMHWGAVTIGAPPLEARVGVWLFLPLPFPLPLPLPLPLPTGNGFLMLWVEGTIWVLIESTAAVGAFIIRLVMVGVKCRSWCWSDLIQVIWSRNGSWQLEEKLACTPLFLWPCMTCICKTGNSNFKKSLTIVLSWMDTLPPLRSWKYWGVAAGCSKLWTPPSPAVSYQLICQFQFTYLFSEQCKRYFFLEKLFLKMFLFSICICIV